MPGMDSTFLSNGLELACHLGRPPGEVQAGPGVILCHGFPIGPLDAERSGGTFPQLMDRAASTLGLDYYSLKKRVQEHDADAPRAAKTHPEENVPRFLELVPAPMGATECILELEQPNGAKLRVHLKGAAAPDLTSLSRGFSGVDA